MEQDAENDVIKELGTDTSACSHQNTMQYNQNTHSGCGAPSERVMTYCYDCKTNLGEIVG